MPCLRSLRDIWGAPGTADPGTPQGTVSTLQPATNQEDINGH